MSKEDEIQKMLDEWKHEYGFGHPISFLGWTEMTNSDTGAPILGKCIYYRNLSCCIIMGHKFKNRPLGWREKSVLWHEFCHACAWQEDGEDDAHNNHWKDLRRRKPWYVLGEWIADFTYSLM